MKELFSAFSFWEGLGAVFAIIQVSLSRKNNVNNYLFGIAGVLIGIWIYYQHKLYADILLNMYYLIMSIYGWFYWKFGRQKQQTPISFSNRKDFITAGSIVFICFGIMAYWLSYHTDSDVPIWDSFVAAFAWAGMWLMAKRKIENWLFLNMSNIIAIPLMLYKGLYIYAALSVFLFVMGILGYLTWRRIYREKRENAS